MMAVIDMETVVYIILDLILALLVLLGNVLVCCAVIYSKLRKKAMYMFVTSLALADIFVGMTAIPFGILTKLGIPYNNPKLCIVMLSFIVISTQISIFNMTAISIERYLAIRHPRFHFTKLTTVTCFRAILVTWLISVLVGFLPVLGWNDIPPDFSSNDVSTSTNSFATFYEDNITTTTTDTATYGRNISEKTIVSPISNSFPTPDRERECKFIKIMDDNYMFFNFVVCVIPALLICAGLYFVIFLSLFRSGPITNLTTLKYNSNQSENMYSKSSFEVLDEKQNNTCGAQSQIDYEDDESHRETIELQAKDGLLKEKPIQQNGDENHCSCLHIDSDETGETSLHNTLSRREITTKKLVLSGYQHYLEDTILKKQSENLYSGHTVSESNATDNPRLHIRQNRARKEIRAAGVLGLIVLAFVICWLPIHVVNSIRRFDRNTFDNLSPWVIDTTILLSHANSAVNFFLYSWRLKAFRDQLRQMLERKSSCVRWWKHK